MKQHKIHTINTISEFHEIANLPKAQHPLISLVDYSLVEYQVHEKHISWIQGFYTIGLKRNIQGKFVYGQQSYDFNEGLLSFIAPGQRLQYEIIKQDPRPSGWLLCIHPDFLWHTTLAKNIKHYDFFGYAVNEALFLSEKEETVIINLMKNMEQEYDSNIDKFSQKIIIAQLEVLLNYADRFYQRQFITRKKASHQLLIRMENILDDYFKNENIIDQGLLGVQAIAQRLNVSPNYLSSLLKNLTGQNTQQHIHEKLIEKGKEKLSSTTLSVSQIAYELGFEHSQSFSRLFKNKVKVSPMEFRANFN